MGIRGSSCEDMGMRSMYVVPAGLTDKKLSLICLNIKIWLKSAFRIDFIVIYSIKDVYLPLEINGIDL